MLGFSDEADNKFYGTSLENYTSDSTSVGMDWYFADGNEFIGYDGAGYCDVDLHGITTDFPGGNTIDHGVFGGLGGISFSNDVIHWVP